LLARLATHQSGVVSSGQLAALGFSRREISGLVKPRRLIRIHQGVYAVGHEDLGDRGRMIAGLLAAGDGAVLSHRTAAFLWKLLPSMPPFIEVTLTQRVPRQRVGVVVHQAKRLDTTRHKALLVTTPRQTLTQLREPERDRAAAEALYLGLIDRHDAPHGAEPTRSELERRLLAALKAAGLPRPLCNHPIGRYRADFLWPEHRLVVETDSWLAHGTPYAFQADRTTSNTLQLKGWMILRFTWKDVTKRSRRVATAVKDALRARSEPSAPPRRPPRPHPATAAS
jgi:very-short-patch-repair endonuclease